MNRKANIEQRKKREKKKETKELWFRDSADEDAPYDQIIEVTFY